MGVPVGHLLGRPNQMLSFALGKHVANAITCGHGTHAATQGGQDLMVALGCRHRAETELLASLLLSVTCAG
jgi:hypothetical protein